ncbi:MAG: hypothetical protein RRZ66_02980, partial [Bacteroidales bacterium]
ESATKKPFRKLSGFFYLSPSPSIPLFTLQLPPTLSANSHFSLFKGKRMSQYLIRVRPMCAPWGTQQTTLNQTLIHTPRINFKQADILFGSIRIFVSDSVSLILFIRICF